MATTVYRNALKLFWMRMENLSMVNSAGATYDTWDKTPDRFSKNDTTTPGLADYYFWQAGQSLNRALQALTYDELYKISPNLISTETVSLTTGSGTVNNTNLAFIFERQKVYTEGAGAIVRMAKRIEPFERDEIINNLNPRKTPSTTQPYFEVLGKTVNVYPTSFSKITIRYLGSCPLQVAANQNNDPFPEGLVDIWADAACRLAAGDLKDSLELVIANSLKEKYSFLSSPRIAK